MTVGTITVTGTFNDGQPCSGDVVFRLAAPLIDGAGKVMVPAFSRIAQISDVGTISIALPANDDPALTPTGSYYAITVRVDGAERQQFNVVVPTDAPEGTVDLSALSPVADPLDPPVNVVTQTAFAALAAEVSALQAFNSAPLQTRG